MATYREMGMSGGQIGGASAPAPKVQTVTEQLRLCRDGLQKLADRMDDLIARTGVNVVNEIKSVSEQTECPPSNDTRSVAIDIERLCERLHRKMDTLDNIA